MTKCRLIHELLYFFPVVSDETRSNFMRKLKCALEKDFAYASTKKIDIFQNLCISKHSSIVHTEKTGRLHEVL